MKYNRINGICLIYKRGSPKIFSINYEDSKATKTIEDMKETVMDKYYDNAISMEICGTNLRETPIKLPKSLKTLKILNNSICIYVQDKTKPCVYGYAQDKEKSVSSEEIKYINILSNFHQLELPINLTKIILWHDSNNGLGHQNTLSHRHHHSIKLPKLQIGLKYLEVSKYILTEINDLPNSIEILNIINCRLEKIDRFPSELKRLNLFKNPIKELPKLTDKIKRIIIEWTYISSLSDLPENLKYLNASHCTYLKTIDKLPSGLEYLNIKGNNSLCSKWLNNIKLPYELRKYLCDDTISMYNHLPELPDKLIELSCQNNMFVKPLPKLPDSLLKLNINGTRISELPEKLPPNLVILRCNGCNLKKLPILPPKLVRLYCSMNVITELPKNIPNSLIKLECYSNNITKLPISINKCLKLFRDVIPWSNHVKPILLDNEVIIGNRYYFYNPELYGLRFNCRENPVHIKINKYYGENTWSYIMYMNAVKVISDWFLECKYNPKYKYCRDRLENEFKKIYES